MGKKKQDVTTIQQSSTESEFDRIAADFQEKHDNRTLTGVDHRSDNGNEHYSFAGLFQKSSSGLLHEADHGFNYTLPPPPQPTPEPIVILPPPEPEPIVVLPPSGPTTLTFEGLETIGLEPMSYIQGTTATPTSLIGDQWIDSGVQISNATLLSLGIGHAVSGTVGIAGVNVNGTLDFDVAVTFTFVDPTTHEAGNTDFFSYSPDQWGYSGNTVTVSAFDLQGTMVAQTSATEWSTLAPLVIQNSGLFHSITVDQTLASQASGGIAIDNVTFGPVQLAGIAPMSLDPTLM